MTCHILLIYADDMSSLPLEVVRGCHRVLVASWQAIDLQHDSGLSQQSDHTPEDNPAIRPEVVCVTRPFPISEDPLLKDAGSRSIQRLQKWLGFGPLKIRVSSSCISILIGLLMCVHSVL